MSWLTTLSLIGKSVYVADAAATIYNTAKKDKLTTKDKVNLVLQSIFTVVQVLDIGIGGSPSASANFKLGTNITAGALDVSRIVTQKLASKDSLDGSDYLDILGALAFRAGDAGLTSIQTHGSGHVFKNNIKTFKDISTVAVTVPAVIQIGRTTIHTIHNYATSPSTVPTPLNGGTTSTGSVTNHSAAARETPSKRGGTSQIARRISDTKRPVLAVSQLSVKINQWLATKPSKLQTKMAALGFEAEKMDANLDPKLEKIYNEVIEEQHIPRCSISKKPIMKALISSYGKDKKALMFEKEDLEQWLKTTPNKAPDHWDESIAPLPLKSEYFITNAFVNKEIDTKWGCVLNEFVARASG